MNNRFAKRVDNIKPSAIRELAKITKQPGVISFAGGWPAGELFPIEEMKQICIDILDKDGKSALQYGDTEGYFPLREIIAGRMRTMGVEVYAENIVITNGSQQGIEFSGKLFIDEGDVIICESPSYIGALNAFKAYLPRFIEVQMDDDGMKMEDLEKKLDENPNAKFIYTIPDFQNPTGRTMSVERRKKLVLLAEKYNICIIEDSPYRDLRFEEKDLPVIKSFDTKGKVIYLGTFSKTFCPGLRVGWIAADSEIIRKYSLIKQGVDLHNSSMAQREVYTFVKEYDFDDHITKIIDVYRSRRDAMLITMEKEFPLNVKYTAPKGGLFVWVDLPEELDAEKVLVKALEYKVAFIPGESFYPNGGNKSHFRLNYATMPEKEIVEGITRLGKLLKSL